MNRGHISALIAATFLGFAAGTQAGNPDSPREWLERMSAAMSQMDYQGTFVYVQGDDVVTMRITHVAGEEGIQERLVSVSGAPREVLRDADGVRWVLGDDHSVLADQAYSRSFFPRLPPDQQAQTERCYALELGGTSRIAGHAVRGLSILPRDDYRYGYTLWLEKHSALPLKWELFGPGRKPLAKLMFTDFRMGSEVDARELAPSSRLAEFKTVESRLPAGLGQAVSQPQWEPSSLPPGFELTAHRFFNGQDQDLFEHFVFSDGLAAVSVYVETESEGAAEQSAGVSRMGTTHAFSRIAEGAVITVVGDVPAATVRYIGDGVIPVPH
jgi:sigma-E factor negative regulatory protein RseB